MNSAVIGLGFGDEGKGVVTEYLCSQNPQDTIVARFSGGQQAAHTVIKGDIKHVFHHFGSGTLSGCPTYWSQYCTFNPWVLMTEYKELISKGLHPKMYIHPEAMVTTFYDMYPEPGSREMQHGTCGHGIFRTKQRHRDVPFTVEDLLTLSPEKLDRLMHRVQDFYGAEEFCQGVYWDATYDIIFKLLKDFWIVDRVPYAENIVLEGSQGLMLDQDIGYMPHCTPSDVTPRKAVEVAQVDDIYLVTRAYQTRHGNGPMTNSQYPVRLINTEEETCVWNPYQGEFRTTTLDIDMLARAKRLGIDEVTPGRNVHLVVTCIDQMVQYQLTHNYKLRSFTDPVEFAKYIARNIGINGHLYINNSPRSTSIERIF